MLHEHRADDRRVGIIKLLLKLNRFLRPDRCRLGEEHNKMILEIQDLKTFSPQTDLQTRLTKGFGSEFKE